jgi:hypothetical protein
MSFRSLWPALSLSLLVAACSDGSGPSEGDATVRLHVVAGASAVTTSPAAGSGPQAATTIDLGGHSLVIDEVQLVLRKVTLHRQGGTDDCTDLTEEDEETPAGDANDNDESCSLLKLGPVLVTLPLDGTSAPLFSIDAEPGTFQRMMFQLHKPSNANGDAALLIDHHEFAGSSVLVGGTFDGVPFSYATDLTVVEHLTLSPPLVVVAEGTSDLTLEIDVSTWFIDQAGTGLIDPAAALGPGQLDARIRQNMRASFRIRD